MQTALLVIESIAVIVVTAAIVILVSGLLREIRKIGKASEDLSRVLTTLDDELAPTLTDVRSAVGNVDKLVADLSQTVKKVDKAAVGVENLIQNASAVKALKSSTANLISVYEGVKQGIKTLRGS
ncbi:MAG: DUF948 domain-containing protein [Armatimonadota bacterium]